MISFGLICPIKLIKRIWSMDKFSSQN